VLWHCWLGDRKDKQPVKNWMLVCWRWRFDWSFACLIAPVVTTTSGFFSSNKIQNEDIPVLANSGPPGKWLLKLTEREFTLFGRLPCLERSVVLICSTIQSNSAPYRHFAVASRVEAACSAKTLTFSNNAPQITSPNVFAACSLKAKIIGKLCNLSCTSEAL